MNDQVLSEVKLREWVRYLRAGVIVVAILIVGGIVKLVMDQRKDARNEAAFSALVEVERSENEAAKEAEALKITAEEAMKKWPAEKKADYASKLQGVIKTHEGTLASAQAALKLARWKYLDGKYPEAVTDYQNAIRLADGSGSPLLKAMAFEGLGVSYEAQNNCAEAVKIYGQALSEKQNPMKPLAYFGKARCSLASGDKAQARASLDAIVKEFPNSRYEKKAKALQALIPEA